MGFSDTLRITLEATVLNASRWQWVPRCLPVQRFHQFAKEDFNLAINREVFNLANRTFYQKVSHKPWTSISSSNSCALRANCNTVGLSFGLWPVGSIFARLRLDPRAPTRREKQESFVLVSPQTLVLRRSWVCCFSRLASYVLGHGGSWC